MKSVVKNNTAKIQPQKRDVKYFGHYFRTIFGSHILTRGGLPIAPEGGSLAPRSGLPEMAKPMRFRAPRPLIERCGKWQMAVNLK